MRRRRKTNAARLNASRASCGGRVRTSLRSYAKGRDETERDPAAVAHKARKIVAAA